MKKIILVCLMAVMGLGICTAQQATAKKGATTVVFTTDIDCDHCVTKIMNNVPSLGKGVKDVTADVKTKELTVVFDASKNSVAGIVKGLESLKVKATPKTIDGKAATCGAATCCKAEKCAAAKECKEGQNCTSEKACCKNEKCTKEKAEGKCCGGREAK